MCPKAQEVWQMATKDKDVRATGHELRAIPPKDLSSDQGIWFTMHLNPAPGFGHPNLTRFTWLLRSFRGPLPLLRGAQAAQISWTCSLMRL